MLKYSLIYFGVFVFQKKRKKKKKLYSDLTKKIRWRTYNVLRTHKAHRFSEIIYLFIYFFSFSLDRLRSHRKRVNRDGILRDESLA